jgi:Ca2+-binding EF-hand superfamily protein
MKQIKCIISHIFPLKVDCPKGLLDKKQFITVYKQFYPQGKAEAFSNEVFKIFDRDHSGNNQYLCKYS